MPTHVNCGATVKLCDGENWVCPTHGKVSDKEVRGEVTSFRGSYLRGGRRRGDA